jgi:putrescine:ornithine antiporter
MKTTCRKMSVVQLTFVTAANMLGAGIIMLPTKLAEVGTISIISWIITSLGSLALAMAFARCGMFTTKPGGMGGYSEYAFGRVGHFMANYAYSVSIVIANVAIAITAVGYGAGFLETTFTPLQTCLYTIALLWIAAALNFPLFRQAQCHHHLGCHHPGPGHFHHRLALVQPGYLAGFVEPQ